MANKKYFVAGFKEGTLLFLGDMGQNEYGHRTHNDALDFWGDQLSPGDKIQIYELVKVANYEFVDAPKFKEVK